MKVEIMFHSSSTPKKVEVEKTYTKGDFFCTQYKDGLIVKYPLLNIFSVANYHGDHLGTTQKCKPL